MSTEPHFDYDLYQAQVGGNFFERVWHAARLRVVKRELGRFSPSARILEIGCNTGPVLIELTQSGFRPIGVDLLRSNVRRAVGYLSSRTAETPRVMVCDATQLCFKEGGFDVVLMLDLLEHADSAEEIVREAHRVLTTGGTALVAVPWQYHPVWLPSVKKIMSGRTDVDEVPDSFRSRRDIQRMFRTFTEVSLDLRVYGAWLFGVYRK